MDPSAGDAPRAVKLSEPPSAGVLLDALLAERQARLESIDAITNRAGVLLGFTGAIVALTALLEHWWLRLLVFVPAAVTVGFSLATLKRELVPGLKPAAVREQLLMQPALGAQLAMLDFLTARHDELVSTITAKAKHLGRTTVMLVVTIGALALAGILEGVS